MHKSCRQLFSNEHQSIISMCFTCFASIHQLVLQTTVTIYNEMLHMAQKRAVTEHQGSGLLCRMTPSLGFHFIPLRIQ